MLDKVSQIAEQAAGSVSRRQFLGRIGSGAAATAAALGGVLAFPAIARSGKTPRLCSDDSPGWCAGLPVGTPCGSSDTNNGVCKAVNRRSARPLCTCHYRGRKIQ